MQRGLPKEDSNFDQQNNGEIYMPELKTKPPIEDSHSNFNLVPPID